MTRPLLPVHQQDVIAFQNLQPRKAKIKNKAAQSSPVHNGTQLPDEILGLIFNELEPHDLMAAGTLCKAWRAVALEPKRWERLGRDVEKLDIAGIRQMQRKGVWGRVFSRSAHILSPVLQATSVVLPTALMIYHGVKQVNAQKAQCVADYCANYVGWTGYTPPGTDADCLAHFGDPYYYGQQVGPYGMNGECGNKRDIAIAAGFTAAALAGGLVGCWGIKRFLAPGVERLTDIWQSRQIGLSIKRVPPNDNYTSVLRKLDLMPKMTQLLHNAVRGGETGTVSALLSVGVPPNAEQQGRKPLSRAIEFGHLDICRAFLQAKVPVDLSHVIHAISKDHLVMTQDLVYPTMVDGVSPLLQQLAPEFFFDIVKTDNVQMAQFILQHAGERAATFINQVSPRANMSPFHVVASRGNDAFFRLCLQHGGDLHGTDGRGASVAAVAAYQPLLLPYVYATEHGLPIDDTTPLLTEG